MFVFVERGGRGCHPGRSAMMRGGFGHRGFGHRRGRDGEGRGGPRGRRMFDGGELRLVLLKLIADEPRHGYDLIRQVEELTGGAYAPSPGIVYPTLTLLDDMGLIEAQQAEGAKKLFAVTDAGTAHLAENAEVGRGADGAAGRGGGRTRPHRQCLGPPGDGKLARSADP